MTDQPALFTVPPQQPKPGRQTYALQQVRRLDNDGLGAVRRRNVRNWRRNYDGDGIIFRPGFYESESKQALDAAKAARRAGGGGE